MAFEMAVQQVGGTAQRANDDVSSILLEEQLGWQGLRLPKKRSNPAKMFSTNLNQEGVKPVTAVCVCVQGGVTTIKKVFESVSNMTPVVLVKGSGKAADLLSDAVHYHSQITRNNQFARADSSSADAESISSRLSFSESSNGPG
jgi:hypothetical protein